MVRHILGSLVLGICCFFSSPLQAQWLVGGGFTIGGTDEGKAGINMKTTFPIAGSLVLSPNVTLFASETDMFRAANTKVRFSTINLDGQLQFDVIDKLVLYPLLGLQVAIFRTEVESTTGSIERDRSSDVGINLGGGGRYQILDELSIFGEVVYTLGGIDQVGVTLGVLYRLAESDQY